MSERSPRNGVQLAVAAYLMWGALTIYWKQLKGFDAIELIAWRMMCAGVVMAVIVTVRGSWPASVGAHHVERVGAALAAAPPLRELGKLRLGRRPRPGDRDRLGDFLAPLLTMLLGVFIFHEATTAQRFAFGAAAVAVVVLTVSYGRPPWIALVIAATWSLYGLVKRRSPLGAIDSLAGETFVSFIPAVIVVIVLAAAATASPTRPAQRIGCSSSAPGSSPPCR